MELARELEARLVTALGWPEWSLRTIEVLSLAVLGVSLVQYAWDSSSSTPIKVAAGKSSKPSAEFRWFQLQYLSVYLILMLADWLQGTNMYTLYSSYGVNVGTLFLTGFLSSAVFGTFLGIYVDLWGRKLGCLIFCVLEVSHIHILRKYGHVVTKV
jgi:Sugar-tranasporters, 12 TM